MKPRNFPGRKAARKAGVKRAQRLPHVADTRFRLGAKRRREVQ